MKPLTDVDSLTHFTEIAKQADRLETREALQEALRDVDEGRIRPAEEAFEDFKRRHALPD